MSGILNKKERIIDFIITDTGKSELAVNELNFQYVSFTDLGALYNSIGNYGDFELGDPVNQSNLLTFEATSLPSDLLILDIEDEGIINDTFVREHIHGDITVAHFTGTLKQPAYASFLTNIDKKLKKQQLIGNKQRFVTRDEFIITPENITFNFTDSVPIPLDRPLTENISAIPLLFQDDDFSSKPNFEFLPPLLSNGDDVLEFEDLREFAPETTVNEVLENLNVGIPIDIDFIETSEDNNLLIQFFERTHEPELIDGDINIPEKNEIKKLKIIKFESQNKERDEIYFIGKTMRDLNGLQSFIKMFTLIIFK